MEDNKEKTADTTDSSNLEKYINEMSSQMIDIQGEGTTSFKHFIVTLENFSLLFKKGFFPENDLKLLLGINMYFSLPIGCLNSITKNFPQIVGYMDGKREEATFSPVKATFLWNLLCFSIQILLKGSTTEQQKIREFLSIILVSLVSNRITRRFSIDVICASNISAFLNNREIKNLLKFPYDEHSGVIITIEEQVKQHERKILYVLGIAAQILGEKAPNLFGKDIKSEDFEMCTVEELIEFLVKSSIIWPLKFQTNINQYLVQPVSYDSYPKSVLIDIFYNYFVNYYDSNNNIIDWKRNLSSIGITSQIHERPADLSMKHRISSLTHLLQPIVSSSLLDCTKRTVRDLYINGYADDGVSIDNIRIYKVLQNDFLQKVEVVILEIDFFVDLGERNNKFIWEDMNIGDIFWLVSLDVSTKALFNTVRQLIAFDTIMKVPPSNREKRMIRFSIDPFQFTLDGPDFYETLVDTSQQLILLKSSKELNSTAKVMLLGDSLLKESDLYSQETEKRIQEFNKSQMNLNYNLKFESHLVNRKKLFYLTGNYLSVYQVEALYDSFNLNLFNLDSLNPETMARNTIYVTESRNISEWIVNLNSNHLAYSKIDDALLFLKSKLKILIKIAHDIVACIENREFDKFIDFSSADPITVNDIANTLDSNEYFFSTSEAINFIVQNILHNERAKEKLKSYSEGLSIQQFLVEFRRLEPLSVLKTDVLRKRYLFYSYYSSIFVDMNSMISILYEDWFQLGRFNIQFSTTCKKSFPPEFLKIVHLYIKRGQHSAISNSTILNCQRKESLLVCTTRISLFHNIWKILVDLFVTNAVDNVGVVVVDPELVQKVQSFLSSKKCTCQVNSKVLSSMSKIVLVSKNFYDERFSPLSNLYCVIQVK